LRPWLARQPAALRWRGSRFSGRKQLKAAQNPYDEIAYPGHSYSNTHPDNLASMAILHGLSPAPVERCRVLEIACGDGANLIPMAYAIPGSEFVGFDLAGAPIERGQARIRELGLKNLRLFQGDLLELSAGMGVKMGQFDYIIAHGIYAWAPEPVRDRVLALCAELLTGHGVAFVSYNTMPLGYMRLMLRDMMLFRTQDIDDPLKRVEEGMAFLHLVCQARPEDDPYRPMLEAQLKRMNKPDLGVVRHDEMSDAYQPIHFLELAQHAKKHGLQYLCESVLPPPPDPGYRAEIDQALESAAAGDLLRKEQLLDFVRMRAYRETLLCRKERLVRRDFPAECFRHLLFASKTRPAEGEKPGATAFVLPGGIKMESNHPGVTALLQELGKAWPYALSFESLEPLLAGTGLALDAQGVALLVRLAISHMIEFRVWNPALPRTIPERPKASAVSRQEVLTRDRTTSLLHLMVSLEDVKAKTLLKLLDGSRTRAELLQAMAAELPETPFHELEAGIGDALQVFHCSGILES
jgi:SAM-dependent methyltransferase